MAKRKRKKAKKAKPKLKTKQVTTIAVLLAIIAIVIIVIFSTTGITAQFFAARGMRITPPRPTLEFRLPVCDDGKCEPLEQPGQRYFCQQDCCLRPTYVTATFLVFGVCGNGACEQTPIAPFGCPQPVSEDGDFCYIDCGSCGNGKCENGEINQWSGVPCIQDCGAVDGDGICTEGAPEDADCGCGDGICDTAAGEPNFCSQDCP